ncbi:hypothetical protein F4813DRAFT_384071 [Daldinia decipiens]|uniref:uncharacterized protein n=1 Tax=Daldinia decipiens TaxID=326647 RepID=UPI0020C54BC4|nr:uncharacterized protein F4813DRAFT_384071 [Daldinia decipiens]KAI1652386.1 hypothetical protein F4813DRAFT_384071 [Daldinia decipiens]
MPIELSILTSANAAGVWLTLAKKGATATTSLTYPQALDEALCYGWIDGQTLKDDGENALTSYSQRFTPREPRSSWSKRNVAHVAHLEREGRMTDAGRRVIEAAKAYGRWGSAYEGQEMAEFPEEFLVSIVAVLAAKTAFGALTRQNRFLMCYRLKSLKTQAGREKRTSAFVAMLAHGEVPYSQKQSVRSLSPTTSNSSSARREKKPTRVLVPSRMA